MARIVKLVPDANLLMKSLRSVGYGTEMAIADIIDNSISAESSIIRIIMDWNNEDSRIIIVDDGIGMTQDDLIAAMKIGSADPAVVRSEHDLGRFGMGLKTAAFSMGRRLTVLSKCKGIVAHACWDLDYIGSNANGEWDLIIDDDTHSDLMSVFGEYEHGTAIFVEKLDRIISATTTYEKNKSHFIRMTQMIEKHLSLVFHRFITDDNLSLHISMNLNEIGEKLHAWNPFVIDNRATQELAEETYWEGGKHVTIQPYVLPHKTKFTTTDEYDKAGGPAGWAQHQGFYLYRNKRLIVYGTWFRMFRYEPAFNLARIRVDIDSSCDFDWRIDIKKASATPPLYIKDMLEKTAIACTERSAAVYNSRGTYARSTASQNLDYVWEQRRSRSGKYSFCINKKHPLLRQLKAELSDSEYSMLTSYLTLVENFAPFMHSGVVDHLTDVGQEHEQEESAEILSTISDIKECILVFKNSGYSDEEIRQTLVNMPNLRPLKPYIDGLF